VQDDLSLFSPYTKKLSTRVFDTPKHLHILCKCGTFCNGTHRSRQFTHWSLQMLGRPKRDVSLIRLVKEWAYECLPLSSDTTLSVMELECHEPGCPPLETVIAALDPTHGARQWKLLKSIPELTRADLVELAAREPLASCSTCDSTSQHHTT